MACTLYLTIVTFLSVVNYGLAQRESFDFIVVGAGSAGSVVINKLSSNPKFKVLCLEAGGNANPLARVPAFAPIMYYTENNYGYTMELQPNMSLGLEKRRMAFTAGKGLGGTSLINFMMHVTPNRKDFDAWAALGNIGWDSESILKYIREFENVQIPNPNPYYRGINGSLDCQELPYRSKGVEAFIQASREIGMSINPDYNGENQQEGAAYLQATLKNGIRHDTYTAFVRPIRNRPNLTIRTYSKALKILIDPATKTAIGVLYFHYSTFRYRRVYANKEVILCAGVFNSPKLLMLSGIGPKNHLQSLDIEVIKDLPVGGFMEDHISFPGLLFKAKKKVNQNIFATALNPINYVKLFKKHTGPLTVPGFADEAVSFLNTNVSDSGKLPDMEIIFFSASLSSDYGLIFRGFLRVSLKMYKEIFLKTQNHPTFLLVPMYYRPKSSGYVKLKSKNPFKDPLLYGNYFTDKDGIDMRSMIAAIRFCQKLSKAPAFKQMGVEQVIPEVSGCRHTKLDSDEYWECLIRHVAVTLWHQVGTCKMGPKTDPTAVVDPTLKVYEILKLRVADNSVAPYVPRCHTNLLAIIIGHKASDLILQEHS